MKTRIFLIALLTIVLSYELMAQPNDSRWSFELNGGVSVPATKLNGTELNIGAGFEGIFHYKFLPHFGAYAGWGWNKFSADHTFAGQEVDFEETGYIFGFQYQHPIGESSMQYYLRAGGLYNHIEVENKEGEITNDTGHGLGWQLAGGFNIPLNSKWSISPGVKFNSLQRDLDLPASIESLNLNYLSARVGVIRKF